MLNNQIALVTGGAKGIGKAICEELASRGATVLINYNKSREAAESLREELIAKGAPCSIYQADVTDPAQVEKLFADIEREHGRLDILVNNAGVTTHHFLMLTPIEKWQHLLSTNLNSVFYCCRLAIKIMINQRSGRIINISSIAAIKGAAGNTAYSASKAAITGFTQSLAVEVGRYNILANAVLPGLINTEMTKHLNEDYIQKALAITPLKRLGEASEVAGLVGFLASDKASFITGQSFVVDGGITC